MADYRHDRRIKLMQDVFACTFSSQTLEQCVLATSSPSASLGNDDAETPVAETSATDAPSNDSSLGELIRNLKEIDESIQSAAPERPLADINKVDLAILRTIVFEANHKKTPKPVLIDEAVELAKEFGSDSSSKFINGVLAKLLLVDDEKVR